MLLDDVGCRNMLDPFEHKVGCCWMMLDVETCWIRLNIKLDVVG